MSADDAKRFMDKVDSDPELQAKAKKAFGRLSRLGKKQGYDFSTRELNQHLIERWQIQKPAPEDDPDTTFSF